MNGLRTLYLGNSECIVTLFDVRDAKTGEQLGNEIVACRGRARLHALSPEVYALVIRPGDTRRLA